MRALVVAVATLLGLLAVPPAAEAGQVGVTIGIAGAGAVQVVEGSLEDGGSTRCGSSNQDHHTTVWCDRLRNSEPFEAWVWLRPFPSLTPTGHWSFDRWEGCDQTRVREGYTECAVHSSAFSSDERSPVVYFRDTVAPTTEVTGAYSTSTEGRYTTSFTVSEGSAQCSIDGAAFAACTSPLVRAYPEGDHSVAVRGVDASGNIGEQDQVSFTFVDTAFVDWPGAQTNTRRAEFEVRSGNGTEFLCSLDNAAWEQCATGKTATLVLDDLADGAHHLKVAARKAGYWMDQFPVEHIWVVDTEAPESTLQTREIDGRNARFTFSEAPDVSTACRLTTAGAGAWAPCTSPVAYADLVPGSYRFEVRATDLAGNVQAVASGHSWVIEPPVDGGDPGGPVDPGDPRTPDDPVSPPAPRDTTAPDATLTGGPAEGSWSLDRTTTFDVASTEAGVLACTLDGAPYTCSPGSLRLSGLSAGTHVLSVAATDAAGNTDATPATRTWTVPRTAPELSRAKRWRLRTAPTAYGGRVLETRRKRATLQIRVSGATRIALVVGGGRRHGTVAVYAGTRKVSTVRLASRKPVTRRLVQLPAFSTSYTGGLRVVVTTRGRPVRIEGLGVATR